MKIKFNLTSIDDAQSFQKIRKEYKEFLGADESVDSAMICESIANYIIGGVDYAGKVCLDLGANIGGFTKVAQDFGASKVIAVECDHRNFNKLSDSFKDTDNVECIHGAVSNSDEDTVHIYKSSSRSKHCSVTTIDNKNSKFKEYDEVKTIRFNDLVGKYSPDIIKIDIEGAEYQIIDDVLAYHPDVLFIEFHSGTAKSIIKEKIQMFIDKYPINQIEPQYIYHNPTPHVYDCLFKKGGRAQKNTR